MTQSSSLECRLYLPGSTGVRHARRALHRPDPGVGHGGHVAAREARHSKLTACLGVCRMQVQPSQPLTQRPRRDAIMPIDADLTISYELRYRLYSH